MEFNKYSKLAYIRYTKLIKKIDSEMRKSSNKDMKNVRDFLFQEFDYKKFKKN